MPEDDLRSIAETVCRQVCDAVGAYPNTRAAEIIEAALRVERERGATAR